MEYNKVYLGDSLEVVKTFPDNCMDCVVTSPPYYALRDYGQEGQIGLEGTPQEYIDKLVSLFREVRRCLKKSGTLWVNIGDSYWGGGWRDAPFSMQSGEIQKGSLGTHCGSNMPSLKGNSSEGGIKDKDLIGIPWMLAFALRNDGWYLRQDIIWNKPNPMPESVKDRCVKNHEYIFLFSKSKKYHFDYEAIQEEAVTQVDPRVGKREEYNGKRDGTNGNGQRAFVPLKTKPRFGGSKYGDNDDPHYKTYSGKEWEPTMNKEVVVRNKRSVWTVNVKPIKEAHFATYPQELIEPCILAGCPEGGVVFDPFMGSGTTGIVARKLGRNFLGCELNPEYRDMAERRIFNEGENLFNQN